MATKLDLEKEWGDYSFSCQYHDKKFKPRGMRFKQEDIFQQMNGTEEERERYNNYNPTYFKAEGEMYIGKGSTP